MGSLFQDLRYGVRTLLKSPGFTLVAVVALALGIGANSAMFGIVNAVLLRPIPYPEPDRLLKVYTSTANFKRSSVSYPNFLDWRLRSRSFDGMAAYRTDNFNLTGQANPERLRGEMVSATLFEVLGVRPLIGRTFTDAEDQRGAAPVAVLTASLWNSRFGGSPSVLGTSITLNDKLYTVVGVVPGDDVLFRRVSLVVPIGQWTEPLFWDRGVGMGTRAIARLKPGVSARQAQAELDGLAAGLAREFPKEDKASGIYALPLREDFLGDVRTPLVVLLAAVGFVLLIACVNVANLLLARSTARRREFAIRSALGARPSRIVRQLLTEGLLLAVAGGALGLAVAAGLNAVFAAKLADMLPRAEQVRLDGSVLAFTAAVAIVASLLFGITPAFQSARADLNETLKEAGRGNTGHGRPQRILVVVEVALALVLTASAGLMIRTMSRLWQVDPGFDPTHVLDFGVAGSPAVHGTPQAVRNGFADTTQQLRAVPGVQAVSIMHWQRADERRLRGALLGRGAPQARRAEPDGRGAVLRRRTRLLRRDAHSAASRAPAHRAGQRERPVRGGRGRGAGAQGVPRAGPARPEPEPRPPVDEMRGRRHRRSCEALGTRRGRDVESAFAVVHGVSPVSGQP